MPRGVRVTSNDSISQHRPRMPVSVRNIRQAYPLYAKDEFVHVFINGFSKCKISAIKEIFCRTGIHAGQTFYIKFSDCLKFGSENTIKIH